MLNTQLEGVNIPFCTLVMKLAGETTYSQMTKTCERRKLETFIKEYLVANPISARHWWFLLINYFFLNKLS